MSHRIIISSVTPPPATQEGIIGLNVEHEVVNVTVEYMPSHELTEKEVGKRVEKLLKQVKQMQATPEEPAP